MIKTAVVTCHLRRCNSELTEAAGHLAGGAGHPVTNVEVSDLAYDLAFARKLSCVEEGRATDAGAAGACSLPKALDTHADGRHDAEACDHCLSLHRKASPTPLEIRLQNACDTLAGTPESYQVPRVRLLE